MDKINSGRPEFARRGRICPRRHAAAVGFLTGAALTVLIALYSSSTQALATAAHADDTAAHAGKTVAYTGKTVARAEKAAAYGDRTTPYAGKIDRHALVTRHDVIFERLDPTSPLMVGNG